MSDDAVSASAALGKSALFRALSLEARESIERRGAVVRLTAGQPIFSKGDCGDALFVVLEGEIEVGVLTQGGRQVRFAALGPGAVFGEMAVIDGGARSADAVASRKSRLLRIAREALLETLDREPKALLALAAELVSRLRKADAPLESAVLLDLAAKLASLLLEESARGQRLVQLSQGEMARRISVSREKLNRKLGTWREDGMVEISRSGVRVLDADGLEALVSKQTDK
jgi:CRP-like cAMP-binding protein